MGKENMQDGYSDILKTLQKSKEQTDLEQTRNIPDSGEEPVQEKLPGTASLGSEERDNRLVSDQTGKNSRENEDIDGDKEKSAKYIAGIVLIVTVVVLALYMLFDKVKDYREQHTGSVSDTAVSEESLSIEDIPEDIDSADYVHHNRVTQEFEPVRVESDFYKLVVRPGEAENEADIEGFYLTIVLENCSKDADLQVVIDSLYLNKMRVECDSNWKLKVGEKGEYLLQVEEDVVKCLGLGPYTSIVIYYSVYDTKHDVKEPVDEYCIRIFPEGEEKEEKFIRDIGPMDVQVFDNKELTLICTGTERDEEYNYLRFYLENKNKREINCILDGFEMDGSDFGGIYETKMLDAGCSTEFLLAFPVSEFGDLHLADMEKISFCLYVVDAHQKTLVNDETVTFKPVKRNVSHQYK